MPIVTTAKRPFALIVAGEGVVSTHGTYTAASTALDRRCGGFNRYMRQHLTIRDDRAQFAVPLTDHTCEVCRRQVTAEQARRFTCCDDHGDYYHCSRDHENRTQARLLARCSREEELVD